MVKRAITVYVCFVFNDTATTEIYTLSLHDALPICRSVMLWLGLRDLSGFVRRQFQAQARPDHIGIRSEEHTSELQSRQYLACRLLLVKKTIRHNQRLVRCS